MPISTDLSVSPYFDDYSEDKDFYKILFQPGVAVQTRELNQLQTMLQKQVERFGDNIFKRGTIIDGCDLTYHANFPYIKIKDSEISGAPVNVLSYVGYNIKNQANLTPLVASITTVVSGFESQNPNLNTIYLRYINSGSANVANVATEVSIFAANDILTVYDPSNVIEKVNIYNSSSGFSNTDTVIFVSALAVQNTTGGKTFANTFHIGDYVTDSIANAQIVAIDSVSNASSVILSIAPKPVDLSSGNTAMWSFSTGTNIQTTNTIPSSVANIVARIGTGVTGKLITGALGELQTINVLNNGSGYSTLPSVSISSRSATTGQIATANVVAQNFLTNIQVANTSTVPVGSGYAMTVGKGIIYQKGYFSRVNESLVIVNKYSNQPDAVSVGFDTNEEIINSNQDQTLLDNATGAPNFTAPGANRLKLTPSLVVKSTSDAAANANFFSITEFSAGNPYKQNRQTVYNIIGNELARRTFEEAGNYVLDPFILNTLSPAAFYDERFNFNISVDPGKAYINGNRIETDFSFQTGVQKGTDTVVASSATISLNYGNYIRVNEMGGIFLFKTGDVVQLWNTASTYLTSGAAATPVTPSGIQLGTARIRSVVLESGLPGTSIAVYRLYLFDIQLATANNFTLVRSIFYNGVNKGIADVVLDNGIAALHDNNNTSLIYYAGNPAVKNANNISYTYRTIANNLTLTTNGIISWTVTGGEKFPYIGTLSSTQEIDLIIVPLTASQLTANIGGSISCNTTSSLVTGTSTTFTSVLAPGDFIKVANSSANTIAQVNNIVSDTQLYLTRNAASAISGNTVIYFPANVPISINRASRTANVDITSSTFYVNLGGSVNTATSVAVSYNVNSSNTTPVNKNVHRDRYVRLALANNAAGVLGPWPLGTSDVFRLKGVYLGANNTFAPGDTGISDVTSNFYIDHNQNEDYYGISYLYIQPTNIINLANTVSLLIKLDHFTDAGTGLKGPGSSGSYNIDDSQPLANSNSTVNTLEIPEMFGNKGNYYDLRDQFDFRPQVANTITTATVANAAPINPSEPLVTARFDSTDKKFPAPDSNLTGVIEYYVGRVSRVTVDQNGQINVMHGIPGSKTAPEQPSDAMTINLLNIPPYPSIPYQLSTNTIKFIDTKVINEKYSTRRLNTYRVSTPIDLATRIQLQPKGYTMKEIGTLENRIASLEYYTSFTLVEALTQKRVISSSSNNAIDRFKFGFFVDDFNNYTYSDISNPAYKASVINGYLCPHAEELMISAESQSATTILPFDEVKFIGQTNATSGPTTSGTADSNSGTVVVTPSTSNSSIIEQITAAVIQSQKTNAAATSSPAYLTEEFYYKMSATSGPVELYFNSSGNQNALAVFQSDYDGGPYDKVVITSALASPITQADVSNKDLHLSSSFEHLGSLERKTSTPVGGLIEDHFKLYFTHNPDGGRFYKISVYKGKHLDNAGPSGQFQYKLFYPVDATVNSSTTAGGSSTPPTTSYNLNWEGYGAFGSYLSPIFSWGSPLGFTLPYQSSATPYLVPDMFNTYVLADQSIEFKVYGLKPLTTHTCQINNVDVTGAVKQGGKLLGQPLISDENGILDLVLYYGSQAVPTSQIEKAAYSVLQQAGARNFRITNVDGTSTCSTQIIIPDYVNNTPNDLYERAPSDPVYFNGASRGFVGGGPGAGARTFGDNRDVKNV